MFDSQLLPVPGIAVVHMLSPLHKQLSTGGCDAWVEAKRAYKSLRCNLPYVDPRKGEDLIQKGKATYV